MRISFGPSTFVASTGLYVYIKLDYAGKGSPFVYLEGFTRTVLCGLYSFLQSSTSVVRECSFAAMLGIVPFFYYSQIVAYVGSIRRVFS